MSTQRKRALLKCRHSVLVQTTLRVSTPSLPPRMVQCLPPCLCEFAHAVYAGGYGVTYAHVCVALELGQKLQIVH